MKFDLGKLCLPIQKSLLLSKKQYAGIVSSRSTGKTWILSWMIVLELMKGHKALVFSQTYSTLKQNLFTEVMKRFQYLQENFPSLKDSLMPEYNKGDMTISFKNGICFGYSYDNYENVRGQSDISLLILDEVAMAPMDLLDVTLPCLRGPGINPKIRFCSTPRIGSPWNRMFKEHLRINDWDIFTGTYKDNIHLSPESIAMIETVNDPIMRKQELEGEIMDTSIENCILADVTLSNEIKGRDEKYVMGIDMARYGNDSTVIIVRDSYQILEKVPLFHADTYKISNEVEKLIHKYPNVRIYIDGTGGFSSGVEDYLKLSYKINSVNFGGKAKDEYNLNARAEMYTNMVKALDEGFYIDDITIKDELFATSYVITNNGKKAIVPKEAIKEILGHSPDSTDALALTFYETETAVSPQRQQELIDLLFR